jgi:DNA-binding response OmpR family regulator
MAHQGGPILLVEDDLSLRECLCQFLKDHGYQTLTADTAAQGWELIWSRRPPLCLLDLNLPDGSGLDLLKRISEHRLNCRAVVMTAFDLRHVRPVDNSGILVGWMTKPVNPLELLEIVAKVMNQTADVKGGL